MHSLLRLRSLLPRVSLPRSLPATLAGRVVLAAYLASVVLLVVFVARHASRVPFFDEYGNFTHLFHDPPLAEYWRQHNEHRIPLPRIVYVAAVKLTGHDFRAPLAVNAVLLAAVGAYLLAAVRRLRGRFAVSDAFIPLIVLGIDQWENLLWGFQLQFVLSTALVLAFLGLAVKPDWGGSARRLAVASLIALLLPLCGANGIPFGLTIGILLVSLGVRNLWRGARAGWVGVIGGALALGLVPLYFVGLQKVGPTATATPAAFLVAFADLLGYGFGPASYLPHGEAYRGLTAIGVATTALLTVTGLMLAHVAVRDPRQRDRALALGALLAGVVGLAVGVAFGRAAYHGAVFAPRYITLFMPGLVIAYFAWVAVGRGRPAAWVPAGLFVAAAVAVVPNVWFTLGVAKFHSTRLKHAEFDIKSGLPVGIVADRHPFLHPAAPDGRRMWLELLRARGISPFRNMAPDPAYVAEPVPLRIGHVEGMAADGGEYRVTGEQGAIVLALPEPRHVHALRVTYTAGQATGLQPRSVVSWDRGGRVPPAPGCAVIDLIDAHPAPAPSVILIDREIDVLRIDLFHPGSRIRVHSLEVLRKAE